MTRICPKCNYARQPTDSCPEWQCPSCQVAYNKVGEAPSREGYGTLAAKEEAAASGSFKWIVLAVVLGAGIWFGKPLWQEKPAASVSTGIVTEQPAVTLYSAEWCGYCTATRKFFISNGIQYVELDVEKSTDGYEAYKKLGGKGVPLIVVGEDVVRGYSEQRLQELLKPWIKGRKPNS